MIKMKKQKVVGRREEQGSRAKANGKRSAASDKRKVEKVKDL